MKMKKQKQWGVWFGIGFGYDKTITGGNMDITNMYFITEEYVFLCFKYGICTPKLIL